MAIARRIFGTDFRRLTYTTYASAGYVACMFFVLYAALGAWFSMYLHIYILAMHSHAPRWPHTLFKGANHI